MNNATPQVAVNPVAVISAVITAIGAMTITAANASNELLSVNSKSLINLSNAGEKVTRAVDERAGIYGEAIVANGTLAEREHTLKHRMRLAALEEAEKQQGVKPPKTERKPQVSRAK